MKSNKTAVRHVSLSMKESQIQQMHQVIVFVLDSEFREWELGGRCAAFYALCFWIMRPLSHPCNTISSAKVRKVILRMKHRTQCWAKCCMQQFKSGLNKMPFRHCRVEQSTAGIALSPENQEKAKNKTKQEKKKGQTEKGKKRGKNGQKKGRENKRYQGRENWHVEVINRFWFAFSFIVKIEVFFKIIIEQKGIDPRPFQLILDTQLKATPCLNETKQWLTSQATSRFQNNPALKPSFCAQLGTMNKEY